MLQVAREAIEARVLGRRVSFRMLRPDERFAGAFVSLYRDGALRGCIGHLEADEPLVRTVAAMAVAAAVDDPRFPPLASDELPGLAIEISVLSPLKPTAAADVVPGRDGVVVRRGERQGVFLPQVAREQSWSRERLLAETCRKAGLAADDWRDPGTEVLTFDVQVLSASER